MRTKFSFVISIRNSKFKGFLLSGLFCAVVKLIPKRETRLFPIVLVAHQTIGNFISQESIGRKSFATMTRRSIKYNACIAVAVIWSIFVFLLQQKQAKIIFDSIHIDIGIDIKVDSERTNSTNVEWHDSFVQDFQAHLQTDDKEVLDVQVPFMVRGGTLYCNQNQFAKLYLNERSRAFMVMLNIALRESDQRGLLASVGGEDGILPIPLQIGDNNGCFITSSDGGGVSTFDSIKSPRLSWILPYPTFGTDWCKAMAVPAFESWDRVKNVRLDNLWDQIFATYNLKYPWFSKQNKVVWRGSTTYYTEYHKEETKIGDIPRGKLVELTRQHPELIDAKFTSLVQVFRHKGDEIANETIMGDYMEFNDQMNYKAILDIDGNTYSERLSKILCTNSVLIKIEPRWVEYFWDELIPMVHYVPASLENLTEVVSYVVDEANDQEMIQIVKNANDWCKKTNTRPHLLTDLILQIKKFEQEIESLWTSHHPGWEALAASIVQNNSTYVRC